MPEIDRSARRAARTRSAVVGLAALLVITLSTQRYDLSTLAVELEAIRGWMDGDSLYAYRVPGSQTAAALSPALALLMAPLALLPLQLAGWLLALAGLAAFLLAVVVLAGPVARRYGLRRSTVVLTVAALSLCTVPIHATFGLGRPDLLLFGLVVADLVALRRAAWARSRATWWPTRTAAKSARRTASRLPLSPESRLSLGRVTRSPESRLSLGRVTRSPACRLHRAWATGAWAGIGTGLAAALAAGPLLVIGYLLVSRQRRAAMTALATAVTVTLAALLVAPSETLTWYSATLWELDRAAPISDPANQSLAGLLARLYGYLAPPVLVWFSFGILLLAVGLIRARSAHTDGDEITAFTLVALTAAAAGPVTGPAETIWLLPAVLILADAAMRRRLGTRVPRTARWAGASFALSALLGFTLLVAAPAWTQPWNATTLALILAVTALPWRNGSAPAIPVTRHPTRKRVAIPVPRGG